MPAHPMTAPEPPGYRHGPKTFVDGRTPVAVFVSDDPLTRDPGLADQLRQDASAARVPETGARPRHERDTSAIEGPHAAADSDLVWPDVAAAQIHAFHATPARAPAPDDPNPQGAVNRAGQGVRIHAPDA